MKRSIIGLICITFLLSCQPEPDNFKLLDDLVVSTNYDTEADFSTYATYAISADTIGYLSNNSQDTILVTPKNGDLPRSIITQLHINLDKRGYTNVAKNENPDIGVNVVIVNDINFFQEVVYPGGYYPYSGYGYYSYYNFYPYVNTYSSNTGALVVEFVDLKNKTQDNKVKIVWTAQMGDIISTVDRIQQSKDAIDQAFVQSPYLDN